MALPSTSALPPYSLVDNSRRCSMELRGARCSALLGLGGAIRPTKLTAPTRVPFRYMPYWMQSLNDGKITLCLSVHACISASPVMSLRNGDSPITCKGLCKVVWNIEADVVDGQFIFLTGDPISLGCWEAEMAVLLSPSKDRANLWTTEIKVPCGINFKYSYFIKEEKESSSHLIWRPGPEYSLSIPFVSNENKMIVVGDFWMRTRIEEPPVLSWGSWLLDIDLPQHQLKHRVGHTSFAGEQMMLKSLNGPITEDSRIFTEEDMTIDVGNLKVRLAERDQPVEEPWLVRVTLASIMDSSKLDHEASFEDEVEKIELPGELPSETEKLTLADEYKLARPDEPSSIDILINSSVCTMQRIAVLEDGKLVELLLEPVKNNVQCDSVYLGVVTKLVPHMGGAFVDIGISRPSLMDIKQNREPFVFPPFGQEVMGEPASRSINIEPDQQLETPDHSSYAEDDIVDEFLVVNNQEDSLQLVDEDFEHELADDEEDVTDVLKMGRTNGALQSGISEAEFDEFFEDSGDGIEDEPSEDFLPIESENSIRSDLSQLIQEDLEDPDDAQGNKNKWGHVRKGTKVIVQVVKEGLGSKGPALTAYPNLRSRFWILIARHDRIGVSKKITGIERTRLRVIAKTLQPPGFGLTVRTVADGRSLEELQKDLDGLLSTWKGIVEHAKSAALAAEEGVDGAVPVILHRAMGHTLSVVQDYFNEKVNSMVVDSPRTYHEVTSYLQEIAPDLSARVRLHDKRTPIFDEYRIEDEINSILSKRIPLANGGSLVIEQTEALVSIDVNGGHGMLGQVTSQEKAVLDVNLAAAKQIAREIRLRDIGGIIVVDFIDMDDESNKRLVYEEVKKAVERDRSTVRVSELSKLGLMEITRKRVRPSVTFMISEPCTCCHATGRVEALETSFSKIEHEICRLLAALNQKPDPENTKSWPRFVLRVDRYMCNYLTSGKRTKLGVLSSSLKVWILLKVARGFPRGTFEVRPFTGEKPNEEQQVAISRLRPAEARTYIPSTKLTLFPVKKWKSRGK